MDTAIGTFQADELAAFTPKLGEVKPRDIFWSGRRDIDEEIVTNLMAARARDGSFFHPILVRDEGASGYRGIAGFHRVEASKRQSGEQAPIWALIYPADTPDALIEMIEIEENLFRKQLTAAKCQAQTIRWVAAGKKLVGSKLATELPVSDAKSAAKGGRGKKAWTARAAGALRLSKTAVQKRIDAAEAAIGEEIDLDCDTSEELERKAAELERKADKRQHAEPNIVRLKRRKTEPRGVVEDSTPQAGGIGSPMEVARKAFDALDSAGKPQLVYYACLQIGLDPFKMAPPAVFGLADEEPEPAVELPAEVAPATEDAVLEQAEHGDEAAVAHTEEDEAAAVQANQGDNGAEFGAEDLQDAGDDVPDAADPAIGVTKCAHCKEPFLSGHPPRKKYGRLYHRGFCENQAKPIAIAA